MASNTTTLHNQVHSSGHSIIPTALHRQKHRNSAIAIALRRRGTHKKYSGISSPVNFRQGFVKNEISARKLAAGLWQLRFVEVSGDGGAAIGDEPFRSSKSKLAYRNVNYQNSKDKFKVTKDQKRKPVTILRSRNGLLCELEAFMPFIKSSKEGKTKLADDQHDSIVTVLLEELLRAQRSINKLKAERNSSKKKVEQFLQNLQDEKVLWKCNEHKKIEKMLDELKDKLTRERRSRERMELLNTKLLHELDVGNESTAQFMKNYEKEKRERKLTEEVCHELTKQIGEDKTKIEKLMRDSIKIYKEVEDEREMMQMTEQWREVRVQMKLDDAKNVLEEKYNQMVELIAYLQMFLRSKGDEANQKEIEDARLIKQVVESVNIQQILELSYNFSKSDDVFPIYEECREKVGKEYSPASNQVASCRNDETMISHTKYSQHRMENNMIGETTTSLCKDYSVEGSFKHFELLKQANSTDHNINPHIARGMKGCIEWPRVIPKPNLKVIPLEERVKSQKSQLQHILKPKAF
ncbi:hypothetical protein MtrunA17_Chr2g0288331 [Medicago truncatula]|uniref:Uncharacterized protein n=1 Tax=Medicago truncatula TaxID=3880 RepID=A0A396J397_MEDTR|nr:myosin heavy chain, muscle [Medicago truncatula]RHN72499.1 hypothetical protein MtrunA17_Chr2g0288331 [Medicago truncatula]